MKRIILLLMASSGIVFAQGDEKPGGSTLGGLFDKVKDLKVPESVTNLPSQLTDLKESYLETAKTVEELKIEVEKLRSEVAALRSENVELTKAVGGKVKAASLDDLLKPIEVSATELVSVYAESRATGDERFLDRYVKVVGVIDSFETATQTIEVLLKADNLETKVRCSLKRDNGLYVEALPAQGRLVSRNDRRTLLSIGQPIAVLGTCKGSRLNIELTNCKIDGLEEKRIDEPETKK